MTAEVTQMFLPQSMVPTEIPLTTKLSPAEYRSPFTGPGVPNFIVVSSFIFSRDGYPQPEAPQQFPFPRQQQCLDLKLGQIVHRRKLTSFIPQPEILTGSRALQPGLQAIIKYSAAGSMHKIPQ